MVVGANDVGNSFFAAKETCPLTSRALRHSFSNFAVSEKALRVAAGNFLSRENFLNTLTGIMKHEHSQSWWCATGMEFVFITLADFGCEICFGMTTNKKPITHLRSRV